MYTKRDETKKIMQKLKLNESAISTEQIRMIRTYVDQASDCRPIMLTSPNYEGEKSIISAKLALAFAEQGKKVLLVDANTRYPSLHHWFQITNESGLTNVLLNREDIQHHYKATIIPGLFVLPVGPIPLNLSNIWVTNKINEMVCKCKADFEVVIFDAPPFLAASDAQILANECDGVILVVKANKTKKEDVLKTKDSLERTNNRIIGVIYQTG